MIIQILDKKQHVEQSYKSCMGVLSLAKKYGNERLIKACSMALGFQSYNYKMVENILSRNIDQLSDDADEQEKPLPKHDNIRGNNYYQ